MEETGFGPVFPAFQAGVLPRINTTPPLHLALPLPSWYRRVIRRWYEGGAGSYFLYYIYASLSKGRPLDSPVLVRDNPSIYCWQRYPLSRVAC